MLNQLFMFPSYNSSMKFFIGSTTFYKLLRWEYLMKNSSNLSEFSVCLIWGWLKLLLFRHSSCWNPLWKLWYGKDLFQWTVEEWDNVCLTIRHCGECQRLTGDPNFRKDLLCKEKILNVNEFLTGSVKEESANLG